MEVFEGKIPSNVELGQMCFSPNTIHHYGCPDYVVALLRDIYDDIKAMDVENEVKYGRERKRVNK